MTGGGWELRDSLTGAAVPMTGTGTAADPFVADGLEIEVGGTADVGDTFLIRPTRGAVVNMDVLVSDPSRIAAAVADPHRRGRWKFRLRLDFGRRSARQHERAAAHVGDHRIHECEHVLDQRRGQLPVRRRRRHRRQRLARADLRRTGGWRHFHRQRQHVRHGRQPQCAAARGRIEVAGARMAARLPSARLSASSSAE